MYKTIGILVASNKKIANFNFGGHLLQRFEDNFLLLFEDSSLLNVTSEYPKNINAIGSTSRMNL